MFLSASDFPWYMCTALVQVLLKAYCKTRWVHIDQVEVMAEEASTIALL